MRPSNTMLRLGLAVGTILGTAFLASGSALATPTLTLEAYVVTPLGTMTDIQSIPFDQDASFTLPSHFGAYTFNGVTHVGYTGTFGGSGASGADLTLSLLGHVRAPTYTSTHAPAPIFIAITEQGISGNGNLVSSFADSGIFTKAGSNARYFAFEDAANGLFPAGNLLASVLPYNHTATSSLLSFSDPAFTTDSIGIPTSLFSLSEGFELLPASGGNPLAAGELTAFVPEPASVLLLGFGGLLVGGIGLRRKSGG